MTTHLPEVMAVSLEILIMIVVLREKIVKHPKKTLIDSWRTLKRIVESEIAIYNYDYIIKI